MKNLVELVTNMSISEGLDGTHIVLITLNKADIKSKSDGNIGEESKFGSPNEFQFAGMKSRSVAGSIDCEAHQGDVVSR